VKFEINIENSGKAFVVMILGVLTGALTFVVWAVLGRGEQ
jgi:hypothetical protein